MTEKPTQQELSENVVRSESEVRFRELIEHVEDIIFSTDSNGIFTYVSPAVEKMTGFTREEVIGARFTGLLPLPDSAPSFYFTTLYCTSSSRLPFVPTNSTIPTSGETDILYKK